MNMLIARSLALIAFSLGAPAAVLAQSATHNWTGFYAGLHAGGAWGDNDADVGCVDPAGLFDGTPNCRRAITAGDFPTKLATDLEGFIGGGQIGYNFQSGNIVFGVEVDFSGTSIDGSDTKSPTAVAFPGVNQVANVSQELEWFGTVRGRIGWATNNWLLYATGGLAFAKVNSDYSWSVPVAPVFSRGSSSDTETGWTIGGGGELSLGQWSLKGEYLYYDLGSQNFNAQVNVFGAAVPVFMAPDFDTQGHIARVGLNYHFN